MRLRAETNKYYTIFIIVLFPLMILADFLAIRYFVNAEINEMLIYESERLQQYVLQEDHFPPSNYSFDTTMLTPTDLTPNQFADTLIYDQYTNQHVTYRTYQFNINQGDHVIRVTVKQGLFKTEELIKWIFISTAFIIILLMSGLFLINQSISKWVWKPFYKNLVELQHHNIASRNPVNLAKSNITEFNILNEVIESLINQTIKDFQNLKDFNEHISHDMQTPLAIIRNKMILLLEERSLNDKALNLAQSVYQETNKLSKIVKSLSLISRIENHEFKRLERVEVRILLDNILGNMEEIIKFKNLEVHSDFRRAEINCDPILANILFTNLLKNAVQHNKINGYIKMYLDHERFEIENTGEILKTETDQLFNRFEKGNMLSDSIGLGLSITQRICEIYGFTLDYTHDNGKHNLSLKF